MTSAPRLHIYSTRHREFTQLLADGFTEETGVAVDITDIKSDAHPRMLAEGTDCLADVVVTLDFRRLIVLAELGLVQPVRSNVLERLVPEHLRDPQGMWFAQSMRARLIFAAKTVDRSGFTYDDLAAGEWKDRLIIRSADHMFNTALIAACLAEYGDRATETWMKGIAANRPLKMGGDRNVARAIADRNAEVGLANSYYYGEMRSGICGLEQQGWMESLRAFVPTFANGRTPVNITGSAVARHARHPELAVAFLEFLAGEKGQRIYADQSYEYPASPDVPPNVLIREAGELHPDTTPFSLVARHSDRAVELAATIPWN
ncbi:extracellular solute-binding protein [Rhizobium sp. NFACC06-2]|uniref:extracellular solute-binding protein n=1 Tax=Rhizobium sp. NFACC06-2 TaxID=1566264 RepID=UPI00087621AA|nr:extracellular solute-binding protein [Rhizobium sp. NFACC06-2]SCY74500.1 iron(III) transport system substrate-binding protein [Rhizobium sp. NFACC06-2]